MFYISWAGPLASITYFIDLSVNIWESDVTSVLGHVILGLTRAFSNGFDRTLGVSLIGSTHNHRFLCVPHRF